uniref:60S ribosomal protein L34 n=1 Tax=Compsopogon caeruleus TaxID=31354 RepID=A0A7S1TDA2_9RHOD|mmetsp:Transcript_18443/g.38629  ORF Transcript_18443/g.38629 Transcript_18443/m.38629 type:complete len:113 (+) Transcript_18443:90-428(+)
MADSRVTRRRRSPYATKSNRIKKIKTPGGKLTVQYLKKKASRPRCGETGVILQGVAMGRPKQYMRMSKPKKSVSRAYGGNLCARAVRDRIVRAFLIEEQRIVKQVARAQAKE